MKFNPSVLRRARKAAGLSMSGLAKEAQVSIGTIHNLETGTYRTARMDVVTKIAGALQKDWRIFFGEDLHENEGGLAS